MKGTLAAIVAALALVAAPAFAGSAAGASGGGGPTAADGGLATQADNSPPLFAPPVSVTVWVPAFSALHARTAVWSTIVSAGPVDLLAPLTVPVSQWTGRRTGVQFDPVGLRLSADADPWRAIAGDRDATEAVPVVARLLGRQVAEAATRFHAGAPGGWDVGAGLRLGIAAGDLLTLGLTYVAAGLR
ncbi:MAG: hypothetical protein HY660_17360, partial [Armatimonadetes bacterium]|nr:hypothetical protein [Armatimonadota bacterium]